jgi:TPR repeat protein
VTINLPFQARLLLVCALLLGCSNTDEALHRDFVAVKAKAEKGDAGAQLALGFKYAAGQGVTKDEHEAVKWILKAAAHDDFGLLFLAQQELDKRFDFGRKIPANRPDLVEHYRSRLERLKSEAETGNGAAQYSVGVVYSEGRGVAVDDVEALKWYRMAAEKGHASAQAILGVACQLGLGRAVRDTAEAAKWYRKAAEQNVATAQLQLGEMLAKGEGVARDEVEAVRWYRKAAEQDIAKAQFWLGWKYAHGEGVPKDEAEAIKWFRKAANQRDAKAQFWLAELYSKGNSVQKDLVQAHAWFNLAGVDGSEGPRERLAEIEKEMSVEQKSKATKLAQDLFQKLK